MRRISRLIDNEQGVALVMALMILLTLTGLVLAFLSASAFEPQISRNHGETVRARYVAEAGVEYAYDTLASNVGSWNSYLAGATCAQGAVLGGPDSTLPGLGSAHGTFTVRIRNDCKPGDERLTGVSVDNAPGSCDVAAAGDATHDGNCKVIVTSTGTIGTTTRTITVVVSKTVLPLNGALTFPGSQADVNVRASSFVIDGRDTRIADRPGVPTGAAAAVYGVAVNAGPSSPRRPSRDRADGRPAARRPGKGRDRPERDGSRRQYRLGRRRAHIASGHRFRSRREVGGRRDDQCHARQWIHTRQHRLDLRVRSRELDVLGHDRAPEDRIHSRRPPRRGRALAVAEPLRRELGYGHSHRRKRHRRDRRGLPMERSHRRHRTERRHSLPRRRQPARCMAR